MEGHAVDKPIAGTEGDKEDDMLGKQHVTAHIFSVRSIIVIYVSKCTAGSGSDNYHECNNTLPEKVALKFVQNRSYRRILSLHVMKHRNGYDGRQPIPGGKVMNETVKNGETIPSQTLLKFVS